MRILLSSLLFLTAAWAAAVEPAKLPLEVGTLTLRGGKVYEGVTITGQDAVGIKITHSGGTARVPFENLPQAIADRFPHGTAEDAEKQKEAEAKADDAHRRTTPDKAPDANGDGTADSDNDKPLEKAPELKGDNQAKIASLKAYIQRMERGITDARNEIQKSQERASKLRSDAEVIVTVTDSTGRSTTSTNTNRSKLNKAEYYDKRAKRFQDQIRQAELLIQGTRSQIAILERADRDARK
ncbi:hypothetical protein [Haloferula sp. BvORR071]|uniref:hypothetical protein n=1 Tax=Haloferula sp. BvORR071 TaxID=1396141 RepID=UPI002240F739|nr:hypothetical protein [Haloferula sp. BvORR071]